MAQYNLGWYYLKGLGGKKHNNKARRYLQKAADNGHLIARCILDALLKKKRYANSGKIKVRSFNPHIDKQGSRTEPGIIAARAKINKISKPVQVSAKHCWADKRRTVPLSLVQAKHREFPFAHLADFSKKVRVNQQGRNQLQQFTDSRQPHHSDLDPIVRHAWRSQVSDPSRRLKPNKRAAPPIWVAPLSESK